jgi:hypothetical protein
MILQLQRKFVKFSRTSCNNRFILPLRLVAHHYRKNRPHKMNNGTQNNVERTELEATRTREWLESLDYVLQHAA